MPDWVCRKCGAINLEGQRGCEACAAVPAVPIGAVLHSVLPGLPRGMHIVRSTPLPEHRPDTTAEQNKAALQIVRDVSDQKYDAAEGRRRLAEIFSMPELVNE